MDITDLREKTYKAKTIAIIDDNGNIEDSEPALINSTDRHDIRVQHIEDESKFEDLIDAVPSCEHIIAYSVLQKPKCKLCGGIVIPF